MPVETGACVGGNAENVRCEIGETGRRVPLDEHQPLL